MLKEWIHHRSLALISYGPFLTVTVVPGQTEPCSYLSTLSEEMVMRTFVYECWRRATRLEENTDEREARPEFYYWAEGWLWHITSSYWCFTQLHGHVIQLTCDKTPTDLHTAQRRSRRTAEAAETALNILKEIRKNWIMKCWQTSKTACFSSCVVFIPVSAAELLSFRPGKWGHYGEDMALGLRLD